MLSFNSSAPTPNKMMSLPNQEGLYAREIETAIVALLMRCPARVKSVMAELGPGWITEPYLQTILAAVISLAASGESIDFNTIAQRLRENDQLEEIGGKEGLSSVYAHPTAYDDDSIVSDYLQVLEDAALQRGGHIPYLRHYNEREAANLFLVRAPEIACAGDFWHEYANGTWKPCDRDKFRPLALGTMHPGIQSARREVQILNLVEGLKQVPESQFCGVYKLDGGHVLINAKNGVIRVGRRGYELAPHSPDHGFTQQLAVEFEPEAQCSEFISTLTQALPDPDDRLLLQLCCGNILLPSSKFEVCLCSYGPSGTGKSTIAEAVAAIFEQTSVQTLSMSQLCDPKGYALPSLKGAVLNLATELDSIEVAESSNWKTIVSGEKINARKIYDSPETMQTTAKLWFLANDLPRFKHGTDAELRRIRFLRFDQKPITIDRELKTRIKAEAPGILVWMLEGLIHLLLMNDMPLGGETTREVYKIFATTNDPLGTFVKERCEFNPAAWVRKSELEEAYCGFLEEHGMPAEKMKNDFFQRLRQSFPRLRFSRLRQDGNRIQAVYGISVKDDSPS